MWHQSLIPLYAAITDKMERIREEILEIAGRMANEEVARPL